MDSFQKKSWLKLPQEKYGVGSFFLLFPSLLLSGSFRFSATITVVPGNRE